jgi:hypothetical protein
MSKKTKLSLTGLRQVILPVGKYYDRKSDKLLSVFGVNKNQTGAGLKPTVKFKNWLKKNALEDGDYLTILKEMEQRADAYNKDAEEQGVSPDKYYTNQIKSKGLQRNKETPASRKIKEKLKSMLEGEANEEDVKKVQSVNPKDLKQIMEDKKKQAEDAKELAKQEAEVNPQGMTVEYTKPKRPRKKEIAGSRIAKRDKKERQEAKVKKLITGEPDVIDTLQGKSREQVQQETAKKATTLLKKKLENNVKKISEAEDAKEQQEERNKVRVVVKEQSSDITDPTSGENSFDNIQLAVTDFKNKTGQGIHTDELMKNINEFMKKEPEMESRSVMVEQEASVPSLMGDDKPYQPPAETNQDVGDDETKEDEPILRGQVQQQGLGGRQGFRRPPQQQAPRRPEEALENTQYGDLTIPQEVERDAGDGRLGISQAPVPQMDIETETISRNKKTIQLLRSECKCFKQIYKDKIKTKRFKTLLNVDLERKSLDEVRLIHKHFTEEVRDYYNSHRGLRVGVIIDPAILGLNIQALQGMIAPRVPSYAPAVDAGRQAEGFSQAGGELRRRPPTGQTPALADTDVHYKLGGVRHATGKYDRDIESLNNHIDREEDKKKSNFGRGSTRFNQAKNFKNSFYQAPSHTNIPAIRLKTK